MGDALSMDHGSVPRAVHGVVNAPSNHIGDYLPFPTDVDGWRSAKNKVY